MFSVFRQRNFTLLWIGQFVSLCGDWLLIVALPFYVYQLTGSILQTGIMFMVEILPRIMLGSLAGVFVDRWDRRWIMIVSDLLRAGILLLLLVVHEPGQLWLIYVVAALQSVISLFFSPAALAFTPSVVQEQQLVAANSLESFSEAATRFIGPPLGGVLFAWLGLAGIVFVDSATFLFSAIAILLISVPGRVHSEKPEATSPLAKVASVWNEWLSGLRLVANNRTISGIFATFLFLMVNQGMMNVLLIIFVKNVMHGDALVLGWLFTSQGVGSLLGAVLIGSVSKFVRPVYLIVSGFVFAGVCLLVVVHYPLLILVLPLIALVGVFVVGTIVTVQTLLQQSASDTFRGRVFGAFHTTNSVMMLVGMLLASTLGASVGVVPLLDGAGILFFLAALVGLLMLRHARLSQPQSATDEAA